MTENIDHIDRRLLRTLQEDAALRVEDLAERVGLSRNACWRRVKRMEEAGILRDRVWRADPAKIGCPLEVVALIRTTTHDDAWRDAFRRTVAAMPEVVGAYRMTGDLDYMLRIRVADVAAYDAVYKRLTSAIALSDISASFVMEEIKETTALPV